MIVGLDLSDEIRYYRGGARCRCDTVSISHPSYWVRFSLFSELDTFLCTRTEYTIGYSRLSCTTVLVAVRTAISGLFSNLRTLEVDVICSFGVC